MERLSNVNGINPIPMQTMFMQQQQQDMAFNESVQFEPHNFMPRNGFNHSDHCFNDKDMLNQGDHAYGGHVQCSSSSSLIPPSSGYNIHANFAGCSRSIIPDLSPQATQSFEDDFHPTDPNTNADVIGDPKNMNSLWSSSGKVKTKVRRKLREPRFCFQTRSDVDVLDDGYKWRKYGQKVVKNSLHPRSYYRCTHNNCRVKKRVERLSEDCRMVITTYEGRHTHSPCDDTQSSENDYLKSF